MNSFHKYTVIAWKILIRIRTFRFCFLFKFREHGKIFYSTFVNCAVADRRENAGCSGNLSADGIGLWTKTELVFGVKCFGVDAWNLAHAQSAESILVTQCNLRDTRYLTIVQFQNHPVTIRACKAFSSKNTNLVSNSFS